MKNIIILLSISTALIFTPSLSLAKKARNDFNNLAEAATTECKKDVQYLLEGEKVPCTGYLFSPTKEYELRFKISTYNQMEQLMLEQEKVNSLLQSRLTNTREYNDKLLERLNKEKDNDMWVNIGFFALGAVLTGFIATQHGH